MGFFFNRKPAGERTDWKPSRALPPAPAPVPASIGVLSRNVVRVALDAEGTVVNVCRVDRLIDGDRLRSVIWQRPVAFQRLSFVYEPAKAEG